MTFNPDVNALICANCASKKEIMSSTDQIKEYDFTTAEMERGSNWGGETSVIKCEKCGAETVFDTYSTAQFCAFCNSPRIVKADKAAGIPPESIIPFKMNQVKAKEYFSTWIQRRYMAPSALKKKYSTQPIKGIYIPYWTYDSETFSSYRGEGGTYYYVTESYTAQENGKTVTKTRQVRHTRWWPTNGDYSRFFDDVLVNASKQVNNSIIVDIEPFDLTMLEGYKPEFLSGFYAERYSVNLKEGWDIARSKVELEIERGVTEQINADEVRNLQIETDCNEIKFKHVLLPVWILAYSYKDKVFTSMINGQTGKVSGHSPVSSFKVLCLIGLGVVVAILIYFMINNYSS